QAVSIHLPEKLDALGIAHSGLKDRGFMSSIYFREPLGLLIELASYKFTPPQGVSHARVLFEAHRIRVAAGGCCDCRSACGRSLGGIGASAGAKLVGYIGRRVALCDGGQGPHHRRPTRRPVDQ
ncbi:hypothetical protein OAH86_10230, partial [Planktomarina temperata]|nr:hypothetical protein [Planktomarina temperata]